MTFQPWPKHSELWTGTHAFRRDSCPRRPMYTGTLVSTSSPLDAVPPQGREGIAGFNFSRIKGSE